MDGARTGQARRQKDGILIEIALGSTRRADAEKAVGGAAVRRFPVRLGADRDCLQAELAAGALNPGCDLAAIGDEDGIEAAARRLFRRFRHQAISASRSPVST